MSDNSYMEVLKDGLKKKITLLDTILAQNVLQREILQNPRLDPDELEENIRRKSELIDQLNMLDDGFEQVYEHVKEALLANRAAYAEEIRYMQECIGRIMEKSNEVQMQEKRNHELMQQKFAAVKKQIRETKTSKQAVSQYYRSMMKMNPNDPQFMDNKK